MATLMDANVTQLLQEWRDGSNQAAEQLWPVIHAELRHLAQYQMSDQRSDHTLQATALVNEAYLKLVDIEFRGNSRKEFFALAAKAMRNILVDHARKNSRAKRGAGAVQVTLANLHADEISAESLLAIDEILTQLGIIDERMARIVELKVFGGLTYDEIAEVLSLSSATIRNDMRFGLAWLKRELGPSGASGPAT